MLPLRTAGEYQSIRAVSISTIFKYERVLQNKGFKRRSRLREANKDTPSDSAGYNPSILRGCNRIALSMKAFFKKRLKVRTIEKQRSK